ncbi:hypothetical protein SCOR_34520 [Sulfidibacter corallicola]|uniref:Uncharacterized protein n=1 Tax=Sulfidibacter corallicola TaxID=2818388 RepID=A0A8A4TIH5_SULCO|nr:hypothetical protein [Sulfidibacter corallicola]QTD49350.1 hypothetical protein J3U87_27510 [Sulfidibacter corallicola]
MAVIKQYVNLPSGVTNVHGNTRTLKLQPNNIPNVSAGDRVEWWVEPIGANNTNEIYLSLTQRARVRHAETVRAASGFFENDVILPHVGGDKWVVKAAKKGDRANFVSTDTFETWRRIYYTVYYVGNASLNFFNSIEADFVNAFKPGFIELVNTSKTASLTVVARVDGTIVRSPALSFPFMAGPPNGIINLAPSGTGTLTNKPFNVALLVAPNIFSTSPQPRQQLGVTAVTGSTVYHHLMYTDPANATAWITQGQVRWPGKPWTNVIPRFSLPTNTNHNSVVRWDFNAVPGLTTHLATAGNTFDMRWTVVKEHRIMGYSFCNFCLVRTIDGTTEVLQTFTHEVGHGVGMAVQKESRWNAAGASLSDEHNPNWHTDVYGGRGNHCSTNAVLGPGPPGLTSGQAYRYGGAGKLCTMFYRGDANVEAKGKFCTSHCEPRMKRVKLDTATMNSRFWNYFG